MATLARQEPGRAWTICPDAFSGHTPPEARDDRNVPKMHEIDVLTRKNYVWYLKTRFHAIMGHLATIGQNDIIKQEATEAFQTSWLRYV